MSRANTPSLLVLHVPAGGGHRAAATAVAEAASARGLSAHVVDALSVTPGWFAKSYVGTHLSSTGHAPQLYGYGYDVLNHKMPLLDGLRGAFDRVIGARLLRIVREHRPIAVVSTHFFPLSVLGHARLRDAMDVPLIGVVTDYTAHAFWAERGVDRYCVAAGAAPRELVRHGVDPSLIVATGIPVGRAFGRVPKRPLGERLNVLVTCGGFGVGPLAAIVRSFAGRAGVELQVVCGAGDERVAEVLAAAVAAGVKAEVVGFERDMARRMASADVVVGKAGGLTVSEALAAGKPLVVVSACPGQESSNLRYLVDEGAAMEAEPSAVGEVLSSARGKLAAMALAARAISAPSAADRVVDVAMKSSSLPLRVEMFAHAA